MRVGIIVRVRVRVGVGVKVEVRVRVRIRANLKILPFLGQPRLVHGLMLAKERSLRGRRLLFLCLELLHALSLFQLNVEVGFRR